MCVCQGSECHRQYTQRTLDKSEHLQSGENRCCFELMTSQSIGNKGHYRSRRWEERHHSDHGCPVSTVYLKPSNLLVVMLVLEMM